MAAVESEEHMARMQMDGKKAENVVVLDHEEHDVELPPVDDAARSVVVADATSKNKSDSKAAPEVRRYVVVQGGSVLENGFRTTLRVGKVIDSLNYDVKRLQQQGIRLQRQETYSGELVE